MCLRQEIFLKLFRCFLFLSFLLTVQNSHATLSDFLGKPCAQALVSESEFLRGQDKDVLTGEIVDLKKDTLRPFDRKWLFRLIMLGKLGVGYDVIDQILGMNYREVSAKVYETLTQKPDRFGREIVWAAQDSMATHPFIEFHDKWKDIPILPGQTVVDIGAGFGRLGIYLGIMRPGVKFIGYELVPERVAEFNRVAQALHLSPEVKLIAQDLSEPGFELALADYYYSWNPVNAVTGKKLWADLAKKGLEHAFSYFYLGLVGECIEQQGFVRDWHFYNLWHSYHKTRLAETGPL